MTDIILETRRTELVQDLRQAMPSTLDDLHLDLEKVKPLEELWNHVFKDIDDRLQELIEQLDVTDENIASAWQRYASVQQECDKVLGECLVLIGGLALRDKGLDRGMCQLADELIEQTRKSYRDATPTFTVPAPQEALAQTLGRIIRLRYPEWSVWTLPLAAHEYGHVLLYETADQTLKHPFERSLGKLSNAAGEGLLAQIKKGTPFLNVLLADAFAAYAMGPAYAFSVVLLRLSPIDAFQDREGQPAAARRACVIFGMLNKMNSIRGTPFGNVVEKLEDEWRATLSSLCPGISLEDHDARCLSSLATDAWTLLTKMLPELEYPTLSGYDGWGTARVWCDHWHRELGNRKSELSLPPDVSGKSKLRDALNAAWLCRRQHPDEVDKIAAAAKDLCQIIVNRSTADASAGVGNLRLSPEPTKAMRQISKTY